MSVLISEPQLREVGLPYLPVMWGILKTYWEHHGPLDGRRVSWLDPVWEMGPPGTLLEPYDISAISVLGLSCYTWNWKLQCAIAARVKTANPGCLVVAGGPDPDYKDTNFFRRHAYVDVIVVKDGEIPFTRILDRMTEAAAPLNDLNALADIPGLYLRSRETGGPARCTGPPEVPRVFDRSPYIEQSDYYDRLIDGLALPPAAVWETNRGCPYKCSYCDWGSNTMSKLRRFDMDRIALEADWFGRHKVGFVMLTDANFGILERDLEIVDLTIAASERYGFPGCLTYNTAKNHPDRTVAIARKLINSGLASAHILSIQHTDADVLAATERSNISVEKQRQVVEQLLADGIPIYVQLILGIPGDTEPVWRKCFADLMEWGIHSCWWVYPYQLLPNAPAAEPAFIERWGVETLNRYVVSGSGARPRGGFDPITDTPARIIVKSSTYSQEDWIRMSTYTAWIKALHNCGLTYTIAVYLRFTHDVSYGHFYDDLIDGFCSVDPVTKDWNIDVSEHYGWYLANDDAVDFMDVPQLPGFDQQLDPSRWLFVQACMTIDAFYGALGAFLRRSYPDIGHLQGVIDYQRNLVVVPDYNPTVGRVFETEFDWVAYFRETSRRTTYSPLPEPNPAPGGTVSATDQAWSDDGATVPYEWAADTDRDRWIGWIQSTVVGRNSPQKNNLQQIELQRPEPRVSARVG